MAVIDINVTTLGGRRIERLDGPLREPIVIGTMTPAMSARVHAAENYDGPHCIHNHPYTPGDVQLPPVDDIMVRHLALWADITKFVQAELGYRENPRVTEEWRPAGSHTGPRAVLA